MMRRLLLVPTFLLAVLASACASAQGDGSESGPAPEVGLVVVNERTGTATAYVQWRLGNPRRLGEVSAGSSAAYQIPVRGTELRVFFTVPGQSPGDPPQPGYAVAEGGDRFRWVLRPDLSVYYLRIE